MTEPRTRRSTVEVRALMLDSARLLFRSKGFESTSTREISTHAGVSESMLFRHFGSKIAMFEEAVLKPFVEFVEDFVRDWSGKPPTEVVPELLADTYVKGLFELCHANLDLLDALRVADSDGPGREAAKQASGLIQSHLTGLADQVERYHVEIDLAQSMDVQIAVRLTVAIVVGAAYLGPEFFGMTAESLATEVAAFVVRGAGYPSDGHVTR